MSGLVKEYNLHHGILFGFEFHADSRERKEFFQRVLDVNLDVMMLVSQLLDVVIGVNIFV